MPSLSEISFTGFHGALYGENIYHPELLKIAQEQIFADIAQDFSREFTYGAVDATERILASYLVASDLVAVEQPGFITSIWCGANRFLHTEVTRHDAALGKIFDWNNTPGQDTYKRYFSKFTQSTNQKVSDYFYSWIFDNVKFDNFVLDIDSSVMTRYGEQEGAKKGYNPSKKGRASHHPLIAFIADVKLVANMWLRSGDCSSSNNFLAFLEDTLSKLKNKTALAQNFSCARADKTNLWCHLACRAYYTITATL